MRTAWPVLLLTLLLTLAPDAPGHADTGFGIGGVQALPDIRLELGDGSNALLSELAGQQPLLLTFFYRRCTGVCTPFLSLLHDATARVGGAGSDYHILALSFDEADTLQDLRSQAAALGLADTAGWSFATTTPAQLRLITGALGFEARPAAQPGQFDHAALLAAVRQGQLIDRMTMAAGRSDLRRLHALVRELRGEFIPVLPRPGRMALGCFRFDARTGLILPDWGLLLLAAPALGSLAALALLFVRSGPPR